MRLSTALFLIATANALFNTLITLLWAYGVLIPQDRILMSNWLPAHGVVVLCLFVAAIVTRGEGK